MAIFEKACFCINLATGAILQGILGIGLALLIVLFDSQYETVVYCAIQIIICGCLICGACMKNRDLLMPWLILHGFGLVVINIWILFTVFEPNVRDKEAIVMALFLADAIFSYVWLLVLSLYQQIEQNHVTTAVE